MIGEITSQIDPSAVCRYMTVMFRRQSRRRSWRDRKTAPKSGNQGRRLSIRNLRSSRAKLSAGTWLIGKLAARSWPGGP